MFKAVVVLADRRKTVVVLHGNAVRLGVVVLLILTTISLTLWLLRRRRTREEEAIFTNPLEEVLEEAERSAEEEVVVTSELPLEEDARTPREGPPPGEELPERRGL